jgi:hypothetical protein
MDNETTTTAPQPTPVPVHQQEGVYEDGKLTYEGMCAVIDDGGSVMYNGAVITDKANLPSQAQLAKGNATKEAAVRKSLAARRAELDAEEARLSGGVAEHIGDAGFPSSDAESLPGARRGFQGDGEGDTAGADGDRGDPNTPAGKKQQEEKEAEDKAREEAGEAAQKTADKEAAAIAAAQKQQEEAARRKQQQADKDK